MTGPTGPGPRTLWASLAAASGAMVLVGLGLVLAVHMRSMEQDAPLLGLAMLASGAGSLGLAVALLRGAERSSRIGIATRLVIPSGLAIAVMLLNIWFTAAMMFISHRDVTVLAVLLAYAGVLAIVAAAVVARSITGGLARLTDAVRRMAGGETGVRVRVDTADEIGTLGSAFNTMAQRVEEAARRQREMDEARRTLLAAVSHDLRTPLSAIRVMLEAIEDGVVDDAQTVDRYHRAMQVEVERLSQLIDDLFELSRIEAGALRLTLEPTVVGELVAETTEAMEAEAERAGVRLWAEIAPGLPRVQVDSQQLYRVLRNLIGNALRHTPMGGTVTLRAHVANGAVTVAVADSGEGIAPEDLPHVFDRFYRGDKSRSRAGGGAGLGLAIVRGIVEAHGGRIDVESRLDHGTTFSFTVPLIQPPTTGLQASGAPPRPPG